MSAPVSNLPTNLGVSPAPGSSAGPTPNVPASAGAVAPAPSGVVPVGSGAPMPVNLSQFTSAAASASLYVGDLHPEVTEAGLFELFNNVGPVASVRVCRHMITRRSLGYGYVNFYNLHDAEKALDQLNYTEIKGRPCRIMWSNRDPSLRKNGQNNVFIKNLDPSIFHSDLDELFSSFGKILSCRVALDATGASKGYGFVHFETKEAADKAISKLNGKMVEDRQVVVCPFVSRKERTSTTTFTNVYFKNYPEDSKEEDVKEFFEKVGKLVSCAFNHDNEGKFKGQGFVSYEDPESAARAVEELNGQAVQGRVLYVARHQKKAERESELRHKYEQIKAERLSKYQGVNLYVKNLDDYVDDEKLRQTFKEYGEITSAAVMRDDKGHSKGFAFVCFANPEDATRALTEMNNKLVGTKPVYVALAQRKEQRRQQLEVQHQQRQANALRMPQLPPNSMFPGAPMFYTQPGMAPGGQRPGFFIAPQMMAAGPRGGPRGWPAGAPPPGGPGGRPGPGFAPLANFPTLVPVAGPRPGGVPSGIPGAPGNVGGRQPGRQPQPGLPGKGGQPGAMMGGQPMQPGAGGPGPQGGRVPRGGLGSNNGFKFNTSVRNNRSDQGMLPQGGPAPGGPQQQGTFAPHIPHELDTAGLADLPAEKRTEVVGEKLYPLVYERIPENGARSELAGKLTGMLLGLDFSELLFLLSSPNHLDAKIREANQVLQEDEAKSGAESS